MRRRMCNHPVQVGVHDERPVVFWRGDRPYEVIKHVKMVGLVRARDDVDVKLWEVRARSEDILETTYELECDHGTWRMVAVWE